MNAEATALGEPVGDAVADPVNDPIHEARLRIDAAVKLMDRFDPAEPSADMIFEHCAILLRNAADWIEEAIAA
jgi:hypothetical protein